MIDYLKRYPLEGAEWGESSVEDGIVTFMAKWWVGDNKFGQTSHLALPLYDAGFRSVRDAVQNRIDKHKEAALPKPRQSKEFYKERDREIWEARQQGATYRALGEQFGISHSRVNQICDRERRRDNHPRNRRARLRKMEMHEI